MKVIYPLARRCIGIWNRRMDSLIIGNGQVGGSLWRIIGGAIMDKEGFEGTFDIIHICFGYSKDFEKEVRKYQRKYKPKYTVIHSTVPVGTSRKLGAIHSPIRGVHPNMEQGIRTFVKFIGGENADEVADYFRRLGLRVYLCRKSETTELLKLLDTAYYGWCIEFAKEVEMLCKRYKVPFAEVYTLANQTYNDGYKKLGYEEYQRPVLQPLQKRIGGHCILRNCDLLKSHITDFLHEKNIYRRYK